MAGGLGEEKELAVLLDEGDAPSSHPGRRLPWRRVTAACVPGVACLLAASGLLLLGPAATGGLVTRLANDVLVLANAGSSGNNTAKSSKNAADTCGLNWEGCLTSQCCKSEGFRCYKKNDQWAQCRTSCTPGMVDPWDKAKPPAPWSCDDWDADEDKCAGPGEACILVKCCRDKKQRCFKKNGQWAQCRISCAPGIDPVDQAANKHATPWSCKKWDDTPETPSFACSEDKIANCMYNRCCKNAGSTCFKKDDGWAACNQTCTKDINPEDPIAHRRKWSCDIM